MIDDVGQILAEAVQQFVAGQPALGGERRDLVGAERVGEVAGRDLLVGPVADPGVGLIAKPLLLELVLNGLGGQFGTVIYLLRACLLRSADRVVEKNLM